MARPLRRRSLWGAGLALLASAGAASAQIGETNNSTNSPLVGAKDNDMNTPEAAALLRERLSSAAFHARPMAMACGRRHVEGS